MLRVFEIGLPIVLGLLSVVLVLRYPLSEAGVRDQESAGEAAGVAWGGVRTVRVRLVQRTCLGAMETAQPSP
jgi:hypothetical protein